MIKRQWNTYEQWYSDYKWISVKSWKPDLNKSLFENYESLKIHHIEEASFLIEEIRKLAKLLDENNVD